MRILIFLLTAITLQSSAQTDTVYKYFNEKWKPVQKDSAFFIGKIIKEDNGYHRKDFWAQTNVLQFDGFFEDAETETENGPSRFYNENAVLLDSINYQHGKENSRYVFYENHAVKGFAQFNATGQVTEQAGYDASGKTIPGYIFQKEAVFPHGVQAWQKYLVKGLTSNQPKAYLDGKMSGTVVVSFLVNKQGNVEEAKVIESSGYDELDQHALNVIKNSPKWVPAVQYNESVIYRQKQSLTYAPQQ